MKKRRREGWGGEEERSEEGRKESRVGGREEGGKEGKNKLENFKVQLNPCQPTQRMVGSEEWERVQSSFKSEALVSQVGKPRPRVECLSQVCTVVLRTRRVRYRPASCLPAQGALYHRAPLLFHRKLGLGTDFKQYPTQITFPQNVVLLLG